MVYLALLLFFFSFVYAQTNSTCQVVVDSSGPPKPFAFCHKTDRFELYWTLPEDSRTVEIAYRFWTDNAWVGAGFSWDGNMPNSQVLIGWFDNGVGEVHEYQLGDYNLGSLATVSNLGVVEDAIILSDKGHTIITYNRTLNDSGAVPVYSKSSNYIVYAWGDSVPSSPTNVDIHADKDSIKVSFTTGAVAGVSEGWISRDSGTKVHGVLMGITFILLLPLGAVIARYMKPVRPPLWFELHRAIQWIGVILSAFAFYIALDILSTETYKTHRALGIITMSLAFWQPFNAFFRPHPPKQGETISQERQIWNLVHHWSGRVCIILGIINVYVGLVDVVEAERGYTALVSVFLVIVFLVAALLGFHKFEVAKAPEPDVKPRVPEAAPFLGANGADSDDDK